MQTFAKITANKRNRETRRAVVQSNVNRVEELEAPNTHKSERRNLINTREGTSAARRNAAGGSSEWQKTKRRAVGV